MPDFVAQNTLETLTFLVRDLEQAANEMSETLNALQSPPTIPADSLTPQALVERVLALDEQISRARLLLPLCTTRVQVQVQNDQGPQLLSLSDLITETRREFDTLARAQLEALIQDAPDESAPDWV